MTVPDAVLAHITSPTPGVGLGWARVASEVAKEILPSSILRIWIFSPIRKEGREWGTAVLTQAADENRYRVFTGRYVLETRGRRKGQYKAEVREVGLGPMEVVGDVIRGVQDRAGDGEPPVEIEPKIWYTNDDEPSS
ncbi:MAG: hypothetical protein OEY63_06445 [Gemmatimonadota bacterium]|nr:hypothetical protein [Gemmatimonadota bacterium]MDH5803559.1 hypothetical protein [Gemmatimonadota bacterium]